MKTVILGAGVTGLSAGYDTDAVVYEATSEAGGLCKTVKTSKYMYDLCGGHWIFGLEKYHEVKKLLKGIKLKNYAKNTGVMLDCIINGQIQDLWAEQPLYDGSIKSWLYQKFGPTLCALFFYPYNDLYTTGLYDKVVQDNPDKSPGAGRPHYNSKFVYPINGVQEIVRNLTKHCTVSYNKKAVKILRFKKIVVFEDGTRVRYDRLISTIPLNELLNMVDIENDLPYTSAVVVNVIGTRGGNLPKEQWIYMPHNRLGMHRIGFYTNVDQMFAEKNNVALYCEYIYRDKIPAAYYGAVETIKYLKHKRFIQDSLFSSISVIPTAYTYQYKSGVVIQFLEELKTYNIHSIGRYGQWQFKGIAESMQDGITARELGA